MPRPTPSSIAAVGDAAGDRRVVPALPLDPGGVRMRVGEGVDPSADLRQAWSRRQLDGAGVGPEPDVVVRVHESRQDASRRRRRSPGAPGPTNARISASSPTPAIRAADDRHRPRMRERRIDGVDRAVDDDEVLRHPTLSPGCASTQRRRRSIRRSVRAARGSAPRVERVGHVRDPMVALLRADRERRVSHPQPRVAALLAVRRPGRPSTGRGTTSVDAGRAEVVGLRIQRTAARDRPQHRRRSGPPAPRRTACRRRPHTRSAGPRPGSVRASVVVPGGDVGLLGGVQRRAGPCREDKLALWRRR